MIIEVFESPDSTEASIEIEIENLDVSRVLPFNGTVGERISKEELKSLLNELQSLEDLSMNEPESYFALKVSVRLDDDADLGDKTPFDIPHHVALNVVLESILQKLGTSDSLQIRIY